MIQVRLTKENEARILSLIDCVQFKPSHTRIVNDLLREALDIRMIAMTTPMRQKKRLTKSKAIMMELPK